jgi:hypothetical protein
VTEFGPVGPGHPEVGFTGPAGDNVPHSQPAAIGQDPACLPVQQGLVGTFICTCWLNISVKVASWNGRSVTSAWRTQIRWSSPASWLSHRAVAVFLGEIHGDHVAAAVFGDVAGGSADSAARV